MTDITFGKQDIKDTDILLDLYESGQKIQLYKIRLDRSRSIECKEKQQNKLDK